MNRQLQGRGIRARRWLRRLWPDNANQIRRDAAQQLYRDLVNQARMPVFYRELGVPDTPEGRFEMVGLHVALLVRRLRAEGTPGRALAQELFDLMFADMDESLRHLGIGELSVGKQIKRLAGHFYARLDALDRALSTVPAAPLAPMLRTNAYHGGQPPAAEQLDALVGYVVAAEHRLRGQSAEDLLAGRARWTAPESESRSALREMPELRSTRRHHGVVQSPGEIN